MITTPDAPSENPPSAPCDLFGLDGDGLRAALREAAREQLPTGARVWLRLPALSPRGVALHETDDDGPPSGGLEVPVTAPGSAADLGRLCVESSSDLPATALSRLSESVARVLQPTLFLLRLERDGLTGLPGRRYLECRLEEAAGPLGLLLADVAQLGRINREHGYETGDRLIVAISELFARHLPAPAALCRYGGDTLAILWPGATREALLELARELQAALPRAAPVVRRTEARLRVGLALADGAEIRQLIPRAESALVAAPDRGSSIGCWEPGQPEALDQLDPLAGLLTGDWGRSQRNLSLLLETLESSNQLVEAERIMTRVVDWTVELSGTERGILFLSGDQGPQVRVARRGGRPATGETLSYATSVVQRVLRTGRPISLSGDAQQDWEHGPSVFNLGLHAVLCLPIRARGERDCRGALYVDGMRSSSFTEEDVLFFEALARQLCPVIERARLQGEVDRLNATLRQKLELTTSELAEARQELSGQYHYAEIVTRSPAMRRVLELIEKVAETQVPVLIQGESGTGKELIARAIHHNGPRREGPFVAENCGALSETLLESELFGHRKGAFTGATSDRQGLLAQADGGTLFLDEIGEMSLEVQKKLLRFLAEGEYRPVGSTESLRADVRVLSATHQDLAQQIETGQFRADLFYRINVVNITLPPLRQRLEDLPLLVDHLLQRHAAPLGKDVPTVEEEVLERMMRYPWPGNVRELENEIQRALVFCGDRLRAGDLPARLLARDAAYEPTEGLDIRRAVGNLERKLILEAMELARGKRADAAQLLGIPRTTLQDKIKKYGLAF